ncbi:hypothetical protein D9757_010019 [Collybiopsis confluens]|uniref:Protein BFR2 n=1 Tax=Collybiopsis confluens TaxID=2823264 RepID=A0A8H5LTW9_9AGAR|nr:hypothetical protein D9757_010019 [Collybiopsis confluens]
MHEIEEPAPADVDPEAIFNDPQPDSADISRAHYVDVGKSTLRKLHDSIADPKYDGIKVSRTQLMEDESDSVKSDVDGDGDEGDDDQPSESDEEEEEGDVDQIPQSEEGREDEEKNQPDEKKSLPAALRKSRDQDKKKGLAVSRQIEIWDSLLDTRIRLQKSITSSNTLPLASEILQDDPEFQHSIDKMLHEAVMLSEQLFQLQQVSAIFAYFVTFTHPFKSLLEVNDSITPPVRKRRKIESNAPATRLDLKEYIDEASQDISQLEHLYHPHLVQTLSKWSSKIQAVAPSVLLPSNRNAFSKDRQHLKTAVQLVDEHLSTHNKLLSRTRQWRGKGQRLGIDLEEGDDVDIEIFDDTDFYQQLLRDVIDARDAAGANDWMVIQKQKKAKKNVDTKASKGRKLRFDVHEKIQNFMTPIHVNGTWHEEQIDELFSSLLGKGFEYATNTQMDDILPEPSIQDLGSGGLGGFRVFGLDTNPGHLLTGVCNCSLGSASCARDYVIALPSSQLLNMDFDDENPFDIESDHISSETSSETTSKANVSESPPSPPFNPSRQVSSEAISPDRPSFPSQASRGQQHPNFKSDFCCARDRILHSGEDVEILITDAQKTNVGATSPYISYVIQTGNTESRHRYSEFESLRSTLAKLYPTLIIPPIPSKQTLGDYAVKQGKAKDDATMIARRKRMLQTFLNRLARHPILSNEHVFHRFLDGEVSWHEVLNSPPVSLLPKNILKAPSHNPTDQEASAAYTVLPNPSAAHPLRNPDQRFLDSEAFTNKFAVHLGGPMEKVTRRTVKRWSEYAQDHAELGAALNGFSLNENGPLSSAIEKTGQAVDATYMTTTKLAQELEQNWAEPINEYSQFSSIIKKLLAYRHQKQVQYEMTQDALDARREQLEELEKSEHEARRLDDALGGRTTVSLPSSPTAENAEQGQSSDRAHSASASYVPPHPGPNPFRRAARPPGMGFLNALSYTLHGMMDVDPETARRSGISKTRENISQLEDALHLAAQDLKYSSSTIQADLDRFQRQKVADIREMTIAMAKSHRDWCKKNLEAWEEAKKEVALIPDHPNRLPSPPPKPSSTNNRRDSTATLNGS